jgi:MFS superfamily sulfate permease-like transporter
VVHWSGSSLAGVRRWLRAVRPQRSDLRGEITAGLPGAISRVPDGMAAAVLAGVNPVQGLYASFAGPIAGGLTSNTRLMVITTTSAAALAAGSALQRVAPADRPAAVPLLVIMVGIALAAAGIARLGRYTRFVSYSVMIGFLTGIAVNIVCGQIADLTGAPAHGAYPLAKATSVISHPSNINLASLLSGLAALVILFVLARTPVATFSTLIALVIPTVVVVLAGADSVARVGDVGGIPGGIPAPRLPDFHYLSFSLVTGALAIAAIVLVQGAGVAEAAPNTDGSQPNPNQDIIARGRQPGLRVLPRHALASNHVTILDVYGSLLYAGARTLAAHLPDPGEARSPVVVLRLRRRTSLGATFVKVMADYADRLADADGRLYLSGLEPDVTEQLRRTGQLGGHLHAFEADPVVGESTRAAYRDAEAWIVKKPGE